MFRQRSHCDFLCTLQNFCIFTTCLSFITMLNPVSTIFIYNRLRVIARFDFFLCVHSEELLSPLRTAVTDENSPLRLCVGQTRGKFNFLSRSLLRWSPWSGRAESLPRPSQRTRTVVNDTDSGVIGTLSPGVLVSLAVFHPRAPRLPKGGAKCSFMVTNDE